MDSDGAVLHIRGGGDPTLILNLTQVEPIFDYFSAGNPSDLAINPNGRGFLVNGMTGLFKLGTPDTPKLSIPVDTLTHFKPFAVASHVTGALAWSPWGDVWVGAGPSLLRYEGVLP